MTDTDELRIDRQDGCAYTLEAFIDPWNLKVDHSASWNSSFTLFCLFLSLSLFIYLMYVYIYTYVHMVQHNVYKCIHMYTYIRTYMVTPPRTPPISIFHMQWKCYSKQTASEYMLHRTWYAINYIEKYVIKSKQKISGTLTKSQENEKSKSLKKRIEKTKRKIKNIQKTKKSKKKIDKNKRKTTTSPASCPPPLPQEDGPVPNMVFFCFFLVSALSPSGESCPWRTAYNE